MRKDQELGGSVQGGSRWLGCGLDGAGGGSSDGGTADAAGVMVGRALEGHTGVSLGYNRGKWGIKTAGWGCFRTWASAWEDSLWG